MPKGPGSEKRPADVIETAILVAKIATGELQDSKKSGRVKSGRAGAKGCAQKFIPKKRSEIAKKAAAARWN